MASCGTSGGEAADEAGDASAGTSAAVPSDGPSADAPAKGMATLSAAGAMFYCILALPDESLSL